VASGGSIIINRGLLGGAARLPTSVSSTAACKSTSYRPVGPELCLVIDMLSRPPGRMVPFQRSAFPHVESVKEETKQLGTSRANLLLSCWPSVRLKSIGVPTRVVTTGTVACYVLGSKVYEGKGRGCERRERVVLDNEWWKAGWERMPCELVVMPKGGS